MSTTKLTGLSALNTRAIAETMPNVGTTSSTATFPMPPAEALALVRSTIAGLSGRGHPKASLHAVARRLARLVNQEN